MTSVIEHEEYFTTLPREYYLSQEIFDREIDQIFTQQWHYVAHESEIPRKGDYVTVQLVGESVMITRDQNLAVNAMLTACRHRGHSVCSNASGNARRFVCPYHNWSFGLDGRLLKAPTIDDVSVGGPIEYSEFGLFPVQVDVWQGMIFVCLSKEPKEPISPVLDDIARDVLPLEPARMKKAYELTYEVDANWKSLIENFLECYHCTGNHPELCEPMDLDATVESSIRPAVEVYGGGLPLKTGMKTLSPNGEVMSRPLLGTLENGAEIPDAFGAGFGIQPFFTRAFFHVDHAVIHSIRPVEPGHVQWVTRWFVHEDAVEGTDYNVDDLTSMWKVTNEQDIALLTEAFRGVKSRHWTPGPLSAAKEPAIKSALSQYLLMMDAPS
ncbi:aromatic ring-hydroxylating oxygenase subunit alpha [Arthrobacter sp. HMWF013]|uniref:aromatic ring-hydroxylating oxygenase subunit alpha n=1 Tax=Arthrobacter sp. HMWF013 TaxID=2056849 RepID=UPI000D341056|nr:aromatic ring-hydroxylating dioxygenase subunit alpha [Arthrobacter sp. HMWF013]PTT68756.1 hypothetical protein DBR22_05650 [Arthrobacter sp. HMWF013]